MSDPAGTAARHLVFDWNLRLVRGLPEAVARDRMAQIESDLWEHATAHGRAGGGRAAFVVAVLGRLARGIPSDLGWRMQHLLAQRAAGAFRASGRAAADGGRLRAGRRWADLQGARPFDQTNGAIDFDTGDAVDSTQRDALLLLDRGVASNIVDVGFGGGL